MNAEQKKMAKLLIKQWFAFGNQGAGAKPGYDMAELLQELVDAPEAEPVARVTGYYAGYLTIATIDGRVLPTGTALYLAPPAPSVPDGWMRAIDEALVVHHIDIADSSDGYEEAKKKLNELLAINSDIARDCSEPPADLVRDAERYRWLREERFDKPYAVTNEHMNAVYEGDDLDKAIDDAIERQGRVMSRDCEHGQLARSCSICDLERELKAVTQQRDKLLAALEKCVGPLELYNAYGWPDRECVIQKTKATIAEAKGQS